MTTISIAMATYNGARFLAEQLDSLARQTLLPIELQVGDDGSSDDTLDILEGFRARAPFPVVISRNEANLGFGENFLQTASRCKGEWIAFSDQDDVWSPAKLQTCADAIAAAPSDLMLIVHDALVAGSSLGPARRMDRLAPCVLRPRLGLPPGWTAPGFRQVFRKAMVDEIPFSDRCLAWHRGYENAHDAWIPLLANALGSTLLLGEPLVTYRRHDTNTTPLWMKPAVGIIERARMALRNNGGTYLEQSAVASSISGTLSRLVQGAISPTLSARLEDSAGALQQYAQDLGTRAAIYQGDTLSARIRSVHRLAQSGRYTRGPWSFGRRALFKDAASALLAR